MNAGFQDHCCTKTVNHQIWLKKAKKIVFKG